MASISNDSNGGNAGPQEEDLNHQIVVIDNGAYTVKGGFAGHDDPKAVLPNCIAKPKRGVNVFVGEETEKFSMTGDMSQLTFQRPFERGYLNDWEIETQVWDHLFSEKHLDIEPYENSLMVTEPLVNPNSLKQQMNEVVFETYGFQSYYRATTPRLAAKYYSIEHEFSDFANSFSHLVVDSGYSWTTVTPVFDEFNIAASVKRVNIGGKALTNYLKHLVSYRHFNVMDETFVINQAKEKISIFSSNFLDDLNILKNSAHKSPLLGEYVLPNFKTIHEGYLRLTNQIPDPDAEEEKDSDNQGVGKEEGEGKNNGSNSGGQGSDAGIDKDSDSNGAGTDSKKKGAKGTSGNAEDARPAKRARRSVRSTRRSTRRRESPEPEKAEEQEAAEETTTTTAVSRNPQDEQILPVSTERISVPELLFSPSNCGVPQGGIVDAIVQSVNSCHPDLKGSLLSNILVVGGNANIPNFKQRLESELRSVIPDHLIVNVYMAERPGLCTWHGASSVASSHEFKESAVTKKEYEEYGHSICDRRFNR